MEEDNFSTGYYKIFFVVGLSILAIFFCFFILVKNRNQELQEIHRKIDSEGIPAFSTITEYHLVQKNDKSHVYTYLLTDKQGKLHEISEYVDEKTHLKLRVGNTIETKYLIKKYFNREVIFSRIVGNKQKIRDLSLLDILSKLGLLFGMVLLGFSLVFYILKK